MVRPDVITPRIAPNGYRLPDPLNVGDILTDPKNGRWLVGPTVGRGGFGEIYLTRPIPATERAAKISKAQIEREAHDNWTHVAKVDRYMGPLFAEINFYIRVAQQSSINQYLEKMKGRLLSPCFGMPHYITSGVSICTRAEGNLTPKHSIKRKNSVGSKNGSAKGQRNGSGRGSHKDAAQRALEERYRFLVIPRFGPDLETWIKRHTPDGQRLDVKRAFWVALQVLETLQYIHHQGYIHGDVKASNILLSLDLESQRKRKAARGRKAGSKKPKMANGHAGPSTYTNGGEPMDVDYNEDTDVEYDYEAELNTSSGSNSTSSQASTSGSDLKDEKKEEEKEDAWKDLKVFLVDFGLAEKYLVNGGNHRQEEEDQRRAHNGTLEFESRDSHVGAICRRSDCEILAFNILSWLSGGKLPWQQCRDHDSVHEMKRSYMERIPVLVDETLNGTARGHAAANHAATAATNHESNPVKRPRGRPPMKKANDTPKPPVVEEQMPRNDMIEFLEVISKMKFKDEPDYERLKSILRRPLNASLEPSRSASHATRSANPKVKASARAAPTDVEMVDITKPRLRHPSEPNRRHMVSPVPRSAAALRQKSVERSLSPIANSAAQEEKPALGVKHRVFARHRSNDVQPVANGLPHDHKPFMGIRHLSTNESSNQESEISKPLANGKRERKEAGLRVVQENEVKLLKQKNLPSINAKANAKLGSPTPAQKRIKPPKGLHVHLNIDDIDSGIKPIIKKASPKKGVSKTKNKLDSIHPTTGVKMTAKETKLEKERKRVEEEVIALVNKRFKDENPTPAMIELYTRIEMKKRGFPPLPSVSTVTNGH